MLCKDVGVFTGYHTNLDRSHMTWMINTFDSGKFDQWGYPQNQGDWSIKNIDRLSGPFSTYAASFCADSSEFPEFTPFGSAYLNGTLADDTCNAGFPFDDVFDAPPANGLGYTHAESKF